MTEQRVMLISIDGVGRRFVSHSTMPHLCRLAQWGASSFASRTVAASAPLPFAPGLLGVARHAGLSTAALISDRAVNDLIDHDAVDVRYFVDDNVDSDARLGRVAEVVLSDRPDVAYVHLVSPDLAGRASGWASSPHIDALGRADAVLARLLAAGGDDCAVVVIGHVDSSRAVSAGEPLEDGTLVVIRAAGVEPLSTVSATQIVDLAPTVADVAGFAPPAHWSGRSLLGTERPTVDVLLDLVESMTDHSYGEYVTMAEHSLQAAANASAAEACAEVVAAALLHDVGHMLGPAGTWGLPSHAEAGADFLQALLPASVVEPIRLHVDAKRYLVATDAAYFHSLSEASRQSLGQQGGAFSVAEAAGFEREPFAAQAVALRRFDDRAKSPGIHVAPVAHYRPLLVSLLSQVHHDARALRDSCVCPECRDATSGQRLLAATDLSGWQDTGNEMLGHHDGRTHHRQIDNDDQADITPVPWRSDHRPDRTHSAAGELAAFTCELSRQGIALARGLDPTPGSVLGFAQRLGFVRATNYGELFDVVNKPAANNLAYTHRGLALHTDNPYRDPVPTVQVLHCLTPAQAGGTSLFCDGFAAAEQLRADAPDAFEVLTSTAVGFRFRDPTVDFRAVRPVIELAVDGNVRAVNVNHRSMLNPRHGPASAAFYDAYLLFVERLNSEDFVIAIDLEAGDVVAFDNRRILHARTAFDTRSARHLQGCYIDVDAIHSAARRAAPHLGIELTGDSVTG